MGPNEVFEIGWKTVIRRQPQYLVLTAKDHGHFGIAELAGGLDDGLEHRLNIEGGPADHLEHLASRGLIFERLLEGVGTAAQFAQEPRVLHRDDRLGGEVFEQRDLFVGKQPNLLAASDNQSEEAVVFPQRYVQTRAYAALFKPRTSNRIGALTYIRHLHNASPA